MLFLQTDKLPANEGLNRWPSDKASSMDRIAFRANSRAHHGLHPRAEPLTSSVQHRDGRVSDQEPVEGRSTFVNKGLLLPWNLVSVILRLSHCLNETESNEARIRRGFKVRGSVHDGAAGGDSLADEVTPEAGGW